MIAAGEVFTAEPGQAAVQRIRERAVELGIDQEKLQRQYGQVPVVSRRELRTAADLLLLIVAYVMDRRQGMETVGGLRRELLASINVQQAVVLTDDETTRRGRIARMVMAFVDAHCAEDVRLVDAAAHVGLSEGYLSHLFRQEAGCTFKQYLTRRRIQTACALLADPSQTVAAVSIQAGFENVNYFAEVFKRVVGMAPRDYRNRVKPAVPRAFASE